jgi:type II secretory pathway pseudopilin PulG
MHTEAPSQIIRKSRRYALAYVLKKLWQVKGVFWLERFFNWRRGNIRSDIAEERTEKDACQNRPNCHNFSRAYAFTLVEILFAVSLIAMVASIVGIRLMKGVKAGRFQASKEILCHKLALAAQLAKLSQSEVAITLEKEKNTYLIAMQAPLSGNFKKYLEKKEKLEEIADIHINGTTDNTAVRVEFSHKRDFPSTAKITLIDSYNTAVDIPLSGYTCIEQKLVATDADIYPKDVQENQTKIPPG